MCQAQKKNWMCKVKNADLERVIKKIYILFFSSDRAHININPIASSSLAKFETSKKMSEKNKRDGEWMCALLLFLYGSRHTKIKKNSEKKCHVDKIKYKNI